MSACASPWVFNVNLVPILWPQGVLTLGQRIDAPRNQIPLSKKNPCRALRRGSCFYLALDREPGNNFSTSVFSFFSMVWITNRITKDWFVEHGEERRRKQMLTRLRARTRAQRSDGETTDGWIPGMSLPSVSGRLSAPLRFALKSPVSSLASRQDEIANFVSRFHGILGGRASARC